MKNFFYNKIIWNYVAAFSSIFDEMEVWVYDENGRAIRSKEVPVYLTPKEKVVAMLQRQGQGDSFPGGSAIDNYLPSLTIIWRGIQLDNERMRGQREKRKLYLRYEEGESAPYQHMDLQTVPYLLQFEVTIWAKYMDDAAQILENILPFFHPEAYVSLFEKSIDAERKCKVELESITPNIVYEMGQQDRRVIQFNLGFNMECNFYKPEIPVGKPILDMKTRLGTGNNSKVTEGNEINTRVKNFYDFDEGIISIIRDLTDSESLAELGFNKLEGNSIKPKEDFHDVLDNIKKEVLQLEEEFSFEKLLEITGKTIPPSATNEEITRIVLKTIFDINQNNEPLKLGDLEITENGKIIRRG